MAATLLLVISRFVPVHRQNEGMWPPKKNPLLSTHKSSSILTQRKLTVCLPSPPPYWDRLPRPKKSIFITMKLKRQFASSQNDEREARPDKALLGRRKKVYTVKRAHHGKGPKEDTPFCPHLMAFPDDGFPAKYTQKLHIRSPHFLQRIFHFYQQGSEEEFNQRGGPGARLLDWHELHCIQEQNSRCYVGSKWFRSSYLWRCVSKWRKDCNLRWLAKKKTCPTVNKVGQNTGPFSPQKKFYPLSKPLWEQKGCWFPRRVVVVVATQIAWLG